MASQELILCIDIGADSIKISEFTCTAENVELNRFAYQEYTNDSEDLSAFEMMLATLKDVIEENDFKAKSTYISLSGQNALIPFIKIPATSTDPEKIRDLVTYEAQSRIPYDLSEVVWDYQVIDNPDGGEEVDAMLVSVKNDEVIRITETIESCGKKVKSIEVSPTALYNAARANGIGDNQCEMILNIGGKSSTLVFLDGSRFFVRSIPVAGNTITQQIAKEFNMQFDEADEIKRRHGFVALGGAYEEPESEMAATVSKIVRNVMTRLHGEINRSINVYRATQHGRKPEKLYLAGGSSIMAFTPRFFVEKLRIPVEYFNPFPIIPIGENVNKESLQELAHLYGETIGLALRHFRSTPVEITLIPDQIKKQNIMRMKRPFFYASAISLLIYLGITYWALDSQNVAIQQKEESISTKLAEKKKTEQEVIKAKQELNESEAEYQKALALVQDRNQFLPIFNKLQDQLTSDKLKNKIWFTKVSFSDEAENIFKAKDSADSKNTKQTRRSNRNRNSDSKRTRLAGDNRNDKIQWLNVEGFIIQYNQSEADTDPRSVWSQLDIALSESKDAISDIRERFKDTYGNYQLISGNDSPYYEKGNVYNFSFSYSLKKTQGM